MCVFYCFRGIMEAQFIYVFAANILLIGGCRAIYNIFCDMDIDKAEQSVKQTRVPTSPLSLVYSSLYAAFVLVTFALVRPHNIPLVLMWMCQLWLSTSIAKILPNLLPSEVALLYMCMGQACFFYQVSCFSRMFS